MRMFLTRLALILVAVSTGACIETEFNLDSLKAKREYSLEIARDVEIAYSDSAVVRVKVQGPVLKRYIYKFKIEDEFPNGVAVQFLDPDEAPQAWMSANYAIRKQNEKTVLARDSVVLFNSKGESLTTYELLWDERDETLSTDKFVMITRPPADTIYARGFRSNQDFTEYTLFSVEGDMTFKNFNRRMEQATE